MTRILKFMKNKTKLAEYLREALKISNGLERVLLFFFGFFLICHIIGCLWAIGAQMDESGEPNWMDNMGEHESKYLTAFYFTVTTITTVGYGDISGGTDTEKVFCIFIQVIGVIGSSVASGTLASIMTSYDSKNAILSSKLTKLKKLKSDFNLPLELYGQITQSLTVNYGQIDQDLFTFVEELPHNLKIQVSYYLHQETYKTIHFLQDKKISFIAWICPLLKQRFVLENEVVYSEGDQINNLYFMK